MEIIKGDLFSLAKEGKFDVIVHDCNCFNSMCDRFGKLVKLNFPKAYEADGITQLGDVSKLGRYSLAVIDDYIKPFVVINAYTQYRVGRNKRQVDYGALELVFYQIGKRFQGKRIAFPQIGVGPNKGGDWKIIKPILEHTLKNCQPIYVIPEHDTSRQTRSTQSRNC